MSLLTAIPTFCGLALALNAAPMHFPPMTEEDPELIAFRVSIAKSSVGMVKMYLEQIACHYDDPEKVHAAVVSAMKYLWNVDCCLGDDEYSGIKCYTATIPQDELDEEEASPTLQEEDDEL